ncbi:hypothetical protein CHCC14437_2914 [Bacillus licheniformis]|nr:hypothetical protein CHCC14437_2914 [Bacillus licheniformis]
MISQKSAFYKPLRKILLDQPADMQLIQEQKLTSASIEKKFFSSKSYAPFVMIFLGLGGSIVSYPR